MALTQQMCDTLPALVICVMQVQVGLQKDAHNGTPSRNITDRSLCATVVLSIQWYMVGGHCGVRAAQHKAGRYTLNAAVIIA